MRWIGEFSRESVAIRVARKLKATDGIEALCELFVSRGVSQPPLQAHPCNHYGKRNQPATREFAL